MTLELDGRVRFGVGGGVLLLIALTLRVKIFKLDCLAYCEEFEEPDEKTPPIYYNQINLRTSTTCIDERNSHWTASSSSETDPRAPSLEQMADGNRECETADPSC